MWSLICVTIASTAIKAQTFTEGKLAYSIEHGKAVLTGFAADQFDENLVIPATVAYNGTTYPVAEVATMAFQGQELVTLVLGENVESMGLRAFGIIPTLTSVTLNSRLSVIGMQAFMGDKGLKSITIPGGVTTVDENAFYNSGLESVTIGAKVKDLSPNAFCGTALKQITVDAANPWFEAADGILYSKGRKSLLHYGGGLEATAFTVPAGVEELGDYSFYGIRSLETLNLGEGLKEIGYFAFSRVKLASLTLPASLESIGSCAFYAANALKEVKVAEGSVNFAVENGVLTNLKDKIMVYCAGEPAADIVVPDGIVAIEGGCFVGKESLVTVSIPASLRTIGKNAFEECPSLTTVSGCQGLEDIGESAFIYCEELKSFPFTGKLRRIGDSAFVGVLGFTEMMLPEGLEVLEGYAFSDCSGITRASIPASVKELGEAVFHTCEALESCQLPAGLKAIPNGTFANCPLTSIDIPASVTYIGDDAFFKSQFAEVKLPDGLRHLGDGAFYDSKLTSITIPGGVDTVGNTCFGHCFSLLTVDFGPGVKVIGSSAINYAGPTKVILHEGLVEVQNLGISLCPDLTEIVLPSTLQKIGPKAFARCPFKSVVAKMPTPPAITEDVATRAFSDWTNYNGDSLYDYCTLHVPAAALEAYKQAPGWRLFKTILGDADGVEGIADDVRVTEIHTLDGLRVAEPVRGSVNIIRYSDGSVRKQYVP